MWLFSPSKVYMWKVSSFYTDTCKYIRKSGVFFPSLFCILFCNFFSLLIFNSSSVRSVFVKLPCSCWDLYIKQLNFSRPKLLHCFLSIPCIATGHSGAYNLVHLEASFCSLYLAMPSCGQTVSALVLGEVVFPPQTTGALSTMTRWHQNLKFFTHEEVKSENSEIKGNGSPGFQQG